MVWDYNDKHPTSRAGEIMYKHTKSTENRDAVNRILDLVDTLSRKHFSSPSELRAYFVRDSQPLFSKKLAKKVYKVFYAKKGGAQGAMGDAVEMGAQRLVSWMFGDNPDSSSIYRTLFVLKDIEKTGISFLPFVTPETIKAGTEIFVEFLLSLASASEAGAKLIIAIVSFGMAPAAVTEGAGAIVKMLVGLLASIIATSRGDFETGFESILLAIPFVGIALNKAYKSEEKLTGKYKQKLTGVFQNVMSKVDILRNAVAANPAYQKALSKVGQLKEGAMSNYQTAVSKVGDLKSAALSDPRFQSAATSFKNKFDAAKSKVGDLKNTALSNPGVQNALSKVGDLKNAALSNPRLQNAATSFKNKLSAFAPKKTLGGRFTRRKRSMDKKAWRRRTLKQRRR
jgi:hypothetical protein